MSPDSTALRRALANRVTGGAKATDPAWQAVAAVPREVFLGQHLYRPAGTMWEPVHVSDTSEDEWLRMAYSDTTWVTQVNGVHAADAPGPVSGAPTSSSTLPSLVVRTMEVADIGKGDRVLEIGTGTGYSTALLCHRLGDAGVVSVEYDAALAAEAAEHLAAAGYAPTLVTGDGLLGYQAGADYDAVISTCAVRSIPPSWLWQLRGGGSITATISGWMLASGMIRLTIEEDGTAIGRFTGDQVAYMLARPHDRPPRPMFYRHEGDTRPSQVNPDLLEDWTGCFVSQLAAPSAELVGTSDGVALVDVATGSQAWTERTSEGWMVHQDGPLRLWDQVEEALTVWLEAGSPDQAAFGMTVTDWDQVVWLGSADGPKWRLPT
ncbi:methyltransferase [Wenjunlia vitaminophila]|uniref:Protein-L-isoaspartate O-methyltransferase n=1 Tax=Wenjunlia vitaminophila TaxID=76728 RepID=A0A0T6LKD7_WENVI|nr:ATP-grasp peptide maturase system methyltransferase [Wenjunlia vitaminophila]KRV46502.1 methyltransferase [Wenjunlia vitaminophila]